MEDDFDYLNEECEMNARCLNSAIEYGRPLYCEMCGNTQDLFYKKIKLIGANLKPYDFRGGVDLTFEPEDGICVYVKDMKASAKCTNCSRTWNLWATFYHDSPDYLF